LTGLVSTLWPCHVSIQLIVFELGKQKERPIGLSDHSSGGRTTAEIR
jgi:hypothetical protein